MSQRRKNNNTRWLSFHPCDHVKMIDLTVRGNQTYLSTQHPLHSSHGVMSPNQIFRQNTLYIPVIG